METPKPTPDAWALMLAYEPMVEATCARLGLRGSDEAADMARDAVLRAAAARDPLRGFSAFAQAYVTRAVLNARRMERARARHDAATVSSQQHRRAQESQSVDEEAVEREMLAVLYTEIAKLDLLDRRLIAFYYWGGLSYGDIAVLTGTSKTTVHRRLTRAVKQLGISMGARDGDDV